MALVSAPEARPGTAPVEPTHDAERSTRRVATGRSAMAATAFPAATRAALRMLDRGGNAVDAAVAAAWALSVCEPSGSGLGGHTTLLIRFAGGDTVVLDGHGRAPEAASRRTIRVDRQQTGYRSCTIPMTPATLGAALERYGTLPPNVVMEPAIRLAADGFTMTELLSRHVRWCLAALRRSETAAGVFLDRGAPRPPGSVLRQERLASTLERLARLGTDDFYRGGIARSIVEDMRAHGGLITAEDLARGARPAECKPIRVRYRDHKVLTTPPPGGGVQVALGLQILEALGSGKEAWSRKEWYRFLAQVIREVFREREAHPVHPDRFRAEARRRILSGERAAELAARILSGEADAPGPAREEPGDTTHLCTADADGTVVSLTQSIQSLFGAKVVHPDLGFFYNNYLSTCPRRRHPHRLRGGAVPRSNVSPTVIVGKRRHPGAERPVWALGAAGSRRIVSSVILTVSGCLDRGMPLAEAVAAPRIHALLSGAVLVERPAATPGVRHHLAEHFPRVVTKPRHSHSMGAVHALARDGAGNWTGVADPRREGSADGW